jgi:hypothetical protein
MNRQSRSTLRLSQLGVAMPRGLKGEKRSADVNVGAVMIARIATSEVDDAPVDDGKVRRRSR